MLAAIRAEFTRLFTLRSTLIYAILLTGAIYGPVALIFMLAGQDVNGALSAEDLGTGAQIFMLVAIVFAAASTASEIRHGGTGLSFLTGRHRWTSYVAHAVAVILFLVPTYLVGIGLGLLVGQLFRRA